jgi:hypothetical protein
MNAIAQNRVNPVLWLRWPHDHTDKRTAGRGKSAETQEKSEITHVIVIEIEIKNTG